MKYLKYLFGIIIVLLLIFIVRGLLTPSVYYESEIVVNKSAQEAWAVMSDESKLSKWIKGFKKTEIISGTPNTIGAVSNIHVEDSGQEFVMEETITNIKQNELLAMTFKMDFMNMDYEILLNESNGKTTIKSKSTTMGNGIFAKSMISFIQNSMKVQEEENLNNLKTIIEENTKDYFPKPQVEPAVEMGE